MSERSGFFNALRTESGYDRTYNANDYSDNLAVVISNGVLRSTDDDLRVTAAGMVATVAAGRGWIKGHWYINDSPKTFDAVSAPISGNRWDRVMLRFDNSLAQRNVYLIYVEGTAASTPEKPAPTRTGDIYDIVLADIYVAANATSVEVTDTRGDNTLCGWVYSTSGDNSFFTSLDNSFLTWFNEKKNTLASVTLFKRYTQNITLTSTSGTVVFDIPQYDADTCFLEVYVNGILDNRHTVSGNTITFTGTLVSGTVVTVNAYKSIDGTGIMTVADEITELQQQFATLDGISKFTYKCSGLNDNIALSQIAQAIIAGSYTVGTLSAAAEAFLSAIGGNTYLASLASDEQVTISVTGKLGATTPYAGDGTADNRYKWFYLGGTAVTNKRIIFDFEKCRKVDITCAANTNNIIFFGNDLHIINADVYAHSSAAACHITMALGASAWGMMDFINCYFKVITTGKAMIAEHGDFTDCYLGVKSSGDNAFCINACTEGLVRLNGGTYFAYIGSSSKIAAVINVEASETSAVVMGTNMNCPTVAQTGYYQQFLARTNNGKTQIFNVVSTMDCTGNATYRSINGQIWKSKH